MSYIDPYQSIIDSVNLSNLTPLSFMTFNERLVNFQTFKFNMALGMTGRLFGDDLTDKVINHVKSEVDINIKKEILKSLFNTSKFDYMKVDADISFVNYSTILQVYNFIMKNKGDYKNIITTVSIASVLQDLPNFIIKPVNFVNQSLSGVYTTGMLDDIEIWVDPYLKFNDGRIILFNKVEYNIEDIRTSIQAQATFSPSLYVSHKLAIDPIDSKILFVVHDENSEGFMRYKSLQRDIKIDDILNEKG